VQPHPGCHPDVEIFALGHGLKNPSARDGAASPRTSEDPARCRPCRQVPAAVKLGVCVATALRIPLTGPPASALEDTVCAIAAFPPYAADKKR
jgi:hypothetical protein